MSTPSSPLRLVPPSTPPVTAPDLTVPVVLNTPVRVLRVCFPYFAAITVQATLPCPMAAPAGA